MQSTATCLTFKINRAPVPGQTRGDSRNQLLDGVQISLQRIEALWEAAMRPFAKLVRTLVEIITTLMLNCKYYRTLVSSVT